MSNKTECPICKSYSSTITYGIEEDGNCPVCGTSQETIFKMDEIESKKKYYKSLKINDEIIFENESLKKELVLKKEKYHQMKDAVWNMYYNIEKISDELKDLYHKKLKEWDE